MALVSENKVSVPGAKESGPQIRIHDPIKGRRLGDVVRYLLVIDRRLFECWMLDVGCCMLVVDCWLLIFDC